MLFYISCLHFSSPIFRFFKLIFHARRMRRTSRKKRGGNFRASFSNRPVEAFCIDAHSLFKGADPIADVPMAGQAIRRVYPENRKGLLRHCRVQPASGKPVPDAPGKRRTHIHPDAVQEAAVIAIAERLHGLELESSMNPHTARNRSKNA